MATFAKMQLNSTTKCWQRLEGRCCLHDQDVSSDFGKTASVLPAMAKYFHGFLKPAIGKVLSVIAELSSSKYLQRATTVRSCTDIGQHVLA